jgi:hypothetical protein
MDGPYKEDRLDWVNRKKRIKEKYVIIFGHQIKGEEDKEDYYTRTVNIYIIISFFILSQ